MICEPQPELMDLILFHMNLEEIEIDTSMLPKDYEVKENISTIKRISFKSYKVEEYLRQEEYNKVHHDAVDGRSEFDNKMIEFNFVKNKTRAFKLRGKLPNLLDYQVDDHTWKALLDFQVDDLTWKLYLTLKFDLQPYLKTN